MAAYFHDFNYSLANEDTRVEQKEALRHKRILAICGSGARVIPLLHSQLEEIGVVDTSLIQLDFLRLKCALIKAIEIPDYLKFLGYHPATADFRRQIAAQVLLEPSLRALAESPLALENGLIHVGQWEQRIQKMSGRIRAILGVDFQIFFEARTLTEQQEIFKRHWPRKRIALLLRLFANRSRLNAQVYRGHLPRGENLSLANLLSNNFADLFKKQLARTSFFHQLLFLGELRFAEGFPIEANMETLAAFRAFQGKIDFYHQDVAQVLSGKTYDFLSLSDVPTFFSAPEQLNFQSLLDRQFQLGTRSAIVRTFLRDSQMDLNYANTHTLDPWQDSTGLYRMHHFEGDTL